MKYLIYICLLSSLLIANSQKEGSSFFTDCIYQKISSEFHRVDNVCMVEILDFQISKIRNHRAIDYNAKIKVIENFKGIAPENLTHSVNKMIGVNIGDTLLIYGYSDSTKLFSRFNICKYKSKSVGRRNIYFESNSFLTSYFQRSRNLLKFELEILRCCTREYKKLKHKDYMIFHPVTIDYKSNLFIQDLRDVYYIKDQVRMAHVKVKLEKFGQEINLTFLNKIPKKIKRKLKFEIEKNVKSYIAKQKEKNYKIEETMISIESFLFPKKNTNLIDF